MSHFFKKFYNDDDGAVTVDFVVLTAAIVILGLLVGILINSGAVGLANEIEGVMDTAGELLANEPIPGQ